MQTAGKLIFFCGKMGAGKTTLSRAIAQEQKAVLLSEDEWLAQLYPDQIISFNDYITYSGRIRPLVKTLVQNILTAGASVVMDFPANTKKQRMWFKTIFTETNTQHEMVYLKLDDTTCLQRLEKRRTEQPERAAFDNEEVFRHVTSFFEKPTEDEGFCITVR